MTQTPHLTVCELRLFISFILMYLMMSAIETIVSHSSLEGQLRDLTQTQLGNLANYVMSFANHIIQLLNTLQELVKEETSYFYFDGEQWIPLPDFPISLHHFFIERIAHLDNLVEFFLLRV